MMDKYFLEQETIFKGKVKKPKSDKNATILPFGAEIEEDGDRYSTADTPGGEPATVVESQECTLYSNFFKIVNHP